MTQKNCLIKKIYNDMNLKYNFFTGFFILIFLMNLTYAQENKILFKINNEIVTSIDVLNEINFLKATNSEFKNTKKNEAYEIAKNSILREKIKEIEILKFIEKIDIDEKILEEVIINNFNYLNINNINSFNNYFIGLDINPLLVKKKISIELLWNRLIFEKFKNKVKINEEELKNELKKQKQNELLLYEILFEVNEGENLNQKFNLIKKTVEEKNFSQAALKFSISDSSKNGGKLGWINETTISKNILDILKKTYKGNYTKPIVIPGGFLILKVEDNREIEKNNISEKEINKIIEGKKNQQLKQYSNIYFNKIKKNILIDEL